ncbi:hypothetical protein D3C71_1496660 [compost metagenome]
MPICSARSSTRSWRAKFSRSQAMARAIRLPWLPAAMMFISCPPAGPVRMR